jgi:hypothetical protein
MCALGLYLLFQSETLIETILTQYPLLKGPSIRQWAIFKRDPAKTRKIIEIVRPMLHQLDPFWPVSSSVIGTANFVCLDMSERLFDYIRIPASLLVQER